MIFLTSVEIIEYRAELAADPDALEALDMIEECEGNLEDAAISLAIQSGQQPDTSEAWLQSFSKRWRVFMCDPAFREKLQEDTIANAVKSLATETSIPPTLATPVVLYVLKSGIDDFCRPLEELR